MATHLRGGPLADVSIDVRPGEILGIAGLLGSGRTELLRMILAPIRWTAAKYALAAFRLSSRNQDAMDCGVAHVPESIVPTACFPDFPCARIFRWDSWNGIGRAGISVIVRSMWKPWNFIKQFAIKALNDNILISALSGGNQQKVVLARWLRRRPRLLLLDEPTQGVDVGAREDVYASVRREVDRGMAAIVVSSDFEELAQVCNRVAILRDGRITGEVSGADLDRHRLTELVLATQEAAE